MKLVIQRVTHASVTVDNNVIGKIGKGYMVLTEYPIRTRRKSPTRCWIR